MDREALRAFIVERLTEFVDHAPQALTDDMGADDVEGWDSLAHVRLLGAIEDHFDIVFGVEELRPPENVGELINLVQQLTSPPA